MYGLARLLLITSGLALGYCLMIVAALAWPASGALLGGVVVVHLIRRGRGRLTTLGSARWAEEDDLRRSGMLAARTGLILGRLAPKQTHRLDRTRQLFNRRLNSQQAIRQFWKKGQRELVRLPQAIHTAVISPSGGGKGVSCAIPFLLTCSEPCVVVDFKGENAQRTAEQRRDRFGHQIVRLDPYRVVTSSPDTFNPLDFIDQDSPHAIDECNDLAKALVIRTGDEKEPHWNDSAEAWIAAVLAVVVQYGTRDDNRSLQTVREFLSHPQKLDLAVQLMCESDCWNGMLARMGGQLLHFVEKEKSSTLTTVARHLRFLDSLAVAESTKSSSFDPAQLLSGKLTVFLILPPEHMRAQSALLRVWIGSLLRAVIRGGLQEQNRVHFVIDEAASVGHLEALDDAVDKFRGYGVRLQFYFQSLGQLKKCFPEGQELTLLSNTTQVFFGVNDNATADYVSARLGESTIVVESSGTSSGSSRNWSEAGQPQSGKSYSANSNTNWQQQTRRLLKPEEVIALDPRTAVTFTPGVPPVRTTLVRYYEDERLGEPPSWRAGFRGGVGALAASLLLCFASLTFAAIVTLAAGQMPEPPYDPQPSPSPSIDIFQPPPDVPTEVLLLSSYRETSHV